MIRSCLRTMTATLFVGLVSLAGCTPEKAQALKNEAAAFQRSAVEALSKVDTILKQNFEMPPLDPGKMVADLTNPDFNADALEELLNEAKIGRQQARDADKTIAGIQAQYDRFAAMLDALPKGSYLAAGEVNKAKKYAVNLTVQMVNLANMLEDNKIQVKLNARRILLVEQIKQHNALSDPKSKAQALQDDAKQVLALREDEEQAKDEAVAQCLKAAEAGRSVVQLSKDYEKLSLSDILTIGQQSLGFASEISNQNGGVLSAVKKYNTVVSAIQGDPELSSLLDAQAPAAPVSVK